MPAERTPPDAPKRKSPRLLDASNSAPIHPFHLYFVGIIRSCSPSSLLSTPFSPFKMDWIHRGCTAYPPLPSRRSPCRRKERERKAEINGLMKLSSFPFDMSLLTRLWNSQFFFRHALPECSTSFPDFSRSHSNSAPAAAAAAKMYCIFHRIS